MKRPGLFWVGGLVVAVIASALVTVTVRYEIRKQYALLQDLHGDNDRLETRWRRLLIEEATLGTASRVERLARERLDMRLPSPEAVVVVKRRVPEGG